MSDLVKRLSEGRHPVELSLRPAATVEVLKDCLKRGFVHVKFTGTRGGTELGIPIDQTKSSIDFESVERSAGAMTVVGMLSLDYVKVKCVAEIDLSSLKGEGWLEPQA